LQVRSTVFSKELDLLVQNGVGCHGPLEDLTVPDKLGGVHLPFNVPLFFALDLLLNLAEVFLLLTLGKVFFQFPFVAKF